MSAIPEVTPAAPRAQRGPPLLVPVLAYVVLTIAAVIVNSSTPHPSASGAAVLAYQQAHHTAVTLGAFLLFSSGIPLAIASAVFYRRLLALGVTAPGSAMAYCGGVLAGGALMLSGMFSSALGRLGSDATPSLARALADLSFFTGGPAFAVMLGLLLAGISVPALLTGLLPRPVAIVGLVLGVVGALSTLTLLDLSFAPMLPVVRFGALLWLVAAAALLPRPASDASSGT